MTQKFKTKDNTQNENSRNKTSVLFSEDKKNNTKNKKPEVKIISFSGQEGATGNMTIYECGDEIIVVDVGISFPDATLPGVDLIIPDFTYLLENSEKIKAVIITHAHEDHLGAMPFLLREIDVPIYSTKIVQEFLKRRIKDRASEEILKRTSFHLLDASIPEIDLGNFKVSAFDVNHSVPNSVGISINTPQGRLVHMADFKMDPQPVLDKPIDLETLTNFGNEGVLCLLSDCLGADTEGGSESESSMNNTFVDLFYGAGERQIMVTLISSNLARIKQIIDAAIKVNRKVVFGGRSIEEAAKTGRALGYLNYHDDVFLSEKQAMDYQEKDLVYVIAGIFGQSGSTADRVSHGEHKYISLAKECRFVVSGEPSPPGSRIPMEAMRDRLVLAGAEVIYPKISENLHISGHGHKKDLETVASIVKPKYFIPIGGSVSHMRAYRNMIRDLGFDQKSVFELLEGDTVVFGYRGARRGKKLDVKTVLVDGKRIGEVGEIVIRDREALSNEGVFVIIVPVSKEGRMALGGVEIVTRGFIYVKESKALLGRAKDHANKIIDKYNGNMSNWGEIHRKMEKDMVKFLRKETGRQPMVIVHSINV